MESKDELKEIHIKNRTCHYFNDITRVMDRDIDFNDILLDEKLYKEKYENISIYVISYEIFIGSRSLHVMFDDIDGFIKICDGIRYLVLFHYGWVDKICDRIKHLISEKSGITDSINRNFERIRIDSSNSLPIKNIDFLQCYNTH